MIENETAEDIAKALEETPHVSKKEVEIVFDKEELSKYEKTDESKKSENKGPRHWSKEEWEAAGKDPKQWKDDKTFEKDGEFIQKIEEKSKIIKELEARLKKLESRTKEEDKHRFSRIKRNLEETRDNAIWTKDIKKVYETDRKLKELDSYAPKREEPSAEPHPEAVKFADRNKEWFNKSSLENYEMYKYAKALDEHLINSEDYQNGILTPGEVLKFVEEGVKKKYPHRFNSEDDEEFPRVESNTTHRTKPTVRDIPKEFRAVYDSVPEEYKKDMPPEKYIKSLKEQGLM